MAEVNCVPNAKMFHWWVISGILLLAVYGYWTVLEDAIWTVLRNPYSTQLSIITVGLLQGGLKHLILSLCVLLSVVKPRQALILFVEPRQAIRISRLLYCLLGVPILVLLLLSA